MKIGKYLKRTKEFLKKFMKRNGLSRGEVWEEHELLELMEQYYKDRINL